VWIKTANLGARFLLEVSALAALGYWGSQTGPLVVSIVLAIAARPAGAALWGVYAAPKSRRRHPGAKRHLVELPFFGAATAGLAATGQWVLAAIFATAVVISELVTYGLAADDDGELSAQ
jgi:hypothetical protein